MKILVQKESEGEWIVWSPEADRNASILVAREYSAFSGKHRVYGYHVEAWEGGRPSRIGFGNNFQQARSIANKYVKEGAQ